MTRCDCPCGCTFLSVREGRCSSCTAGVHRSDLEQASDWLGLAERDAATVPGYRPPPPEDTDPEDDEVLP